MRKDEERKLEILEKLDGIDAAVFSDDAFHDMGMVDTMRDYIYRWQNQMAVIEDIIKTEKN